MALSHTEINSIITVSGAVSAAAITGFVTYFVTSRSTKVVKEESAVQRKHELSMAKEERAQIRRLDAYLVIQRYLSKWRTFADQMQVTFKFQPSDFTYPSLQFADDAEAMAALLASPQIVELVTNVQRDIALLRIESENASFLENLRMPGNRESLEDFRKARKDAQRAALALSQSIEIAHQRMRAELSGSDDTAPNPRRFLSALNTEGGN